jgi:hypothetical protein
MPKTACEKTESDRGCRRRLSRTFACGFSCLLFTLSPSKDTARTCGPIAR